MCCGIAVPIQAPWKESRSYRFAMCNELVRSSYDVRELPAITAACAYASDDEADAERAYEALKRWVTSCGHKLAGAKREIYRDGLLEIQFPLA